MKFLIKYSNEELNLQEFVARGLTSSDYGNGAIEDLQCTSSNIVEAFSRLLEVLSVSQDDVHYIVKGYRDTAYERSKRE